MELHSALNDVKRSREDPTDFRVNDGRRRVCSPVSTTDSSTLRPTARLGITRIHSPASPDRTVALRARGRHDRLVRRRPTALRRGHRGRRNRPRDRRTHRHAVRPDRRQDPPDSHRVLECSRRFRRHAQGVSGSHRRAGRSRRPASPRDAVEIHHDRERDFAATSTDATVTGHVPEQFEELLAAEPSEFPRSTDDGRYEEGGSARSRFSTSLSRGDAGCDHRDGSFRAGRRPNRRP